jgi:hypothetical protein
VLSPQSPWTLSDFKSYWPFLRKYQTSHQTFADLSRLVVFGKLVWPISAVCFGPPWDVEGLGNIHPVVTASSG